METNIVENAGVRPDQKCEICRGACWHPYDNAATQAAAIQMFGVIPNKCVNGEGGVVHCPYANK